MVAKRVADLTMLAEKTGSDPVLAESGSEGAVLDEVDRAGLSSVLGKPQGLLRKLFGFEK